MDNGGPAACENADMSSQQRFMSIPDVAEVLNVSVRQVRALLTSGELRGIQIGGRGVWRIEHDELERFIARQYERTAEQINADAARERSRTTES